MTKGFALLLVLLPFSIRANDLSLEEAWQVIAAESKAQQSASFSLQAARAAKERAGLHWLPRVYLDAKAFQTNDPGLSFFSLLSQRSVNTNDFNPSSLNHPESHLNTRGAIGLDLALYEGGMKVAQLEMQDHFLAGKIAEADFVREGQFLELARAYGTISVLGAQKEKFSEIQSIVSRIIHSYQIGNKSNLVGYSGLLGLKTLANRIQGLLLENQAKSKAHRIEINEMGLKQSEWDPNNINVLISGKDGESEVFT